MTTSFRIFCAAACVSAYLFAAACAAQTPSKPASNYAAESFVVQSDDWVYSENAEGAGYRERTAVVSVQSEAAVKALGVVSMDFASAIEHVEFHYARVRHKDGAITETPVSDVIEQPEQVTREAPFYSDLKQAQLPIKNLQVGDTLEWQVRVIRTRSEAKDEFWGQQSFLSPSDGVVLEESIELRVPATVAVTVWTNPELGVKPAEASEGAISRYRWQTAQLEPTAGEQADAAKKLRRDRALTPAEDLADTEGKLPSVMWTTFKSWAAVGEWYRGLEGSRATPDDEIRSKVKELTAADTTEDARVRSVYAYVATKIHYIGVAFGIGRYQPHEAVDVLHNQYGDCKDKATLLASMLEALGLHPDTVLIGADIRLNEAVPSPQSFNHAITRVKVDDEEVWLDATTEVAPYRVLLYSLRDKLALVVPETGTPELLRTPKDLPFPNLITWKAVGQLNKDGVSESHITMTLRGDFEVIFREAVHLVPPGQYEQLGKNLVQSLGYSGDVSHATFSKPEDTADPFTISFDYHREKAGDWDNLRTIPQLLPIPLQQVDEKDPPFPSFAIGPPHTEISNAEMKLPAGWSAELPEAVHAVSKWATVDTTYKLDHGTVFTQRRVVILLPKVKSGDWKAYKKFADAAGVAAEPYIQLVRGSGSTTEISPPSKATDDSGGSTPPSVSKLFEEYAAAMQKHDMDAAKASLKKIEAIDSKAPKLWAAYGAIALMMGAPNEAIADCKTEVALHPKEIQVYPILAAAQGMNHNESAALATLRTWAAADPENPQPQEALAQASYQKKNYAEAAAYGEKAITLLGDSGDETKLQALQQITGESELKSGKTAEGEARLVKLLNTTTNPNLINNAAYALAVQKLDLPLDAAKIKEAVDTMETETQNWTMDESTQTLRSVTSNLIAAWDTLGWVYFLQGEPLNALPYISAAFHNEQHAEVRDHLQQVLAALPADSHPKISKDLHLSEQDNRTFLLGSAKGRHITVECRILLSDGHAEKVRPLSPELSDEEAEQLVKAVDFSMLFPEGSKAKLVRAGMVNCVGATCSLVLEP